MIGSTLGLLGAGALAMTRLTSVSALGEASAPLLGEPIDGAAHQSEPAHRLRLENSLGFPVELTAPLVVANNFGGYSRANGPGGHKGVDIWRGDAVAGQPLVACIDAFIVEQNVFDGNQGNSWVLQDDNGDAYRYHHMETFVEGLAIGDRVQRGGLLGTMGSTGNPNAPHLHFEVRRGGPIGTPVDPVPLFMLPIDDVTVL